MTPGDFHKMPATGDGAWNEGITMWLAPGTRLQKVALPFYRRDISNGTEFATIIPNPTKKIPSAVKLFYGPG